MVAWFFLAMFAAFGPVGSSTIASTVIYQNDFSGGSGNYAGGFWTMSDLGFTTLNGPLVQTPYLQAVTFKSGGTVNATNADLYLKVFDNALSLVGISTNTINPSTIAEFDNLTWTFNNLTLNKDSGYAYVVGAGNGNTLSNENARIKASAPAAPNGPLVTGGLIGFSNYTQADPTYDPTVNSISLSTPGTILGQPQHAAVGTYAGASWALSDSGFAAAGLPLTQAMNLELVRFERGPSNDGTSGNLYLKVFTDSDDFVGVSTNTVNQLALSAGDVMDWLFDGLILDKDTTYRYFFSTTNDSSFANATARLAVSDNPGPLSTNLFNGSYVVVNPGYNPTMHVVVTPVPEPTSSILAVVGLLSLVSCARTRGKS